MSLQTPYLAAENSPALRRSRALHRTIVASPILLLIAVGLVGHVHPRPYAHPAGTADYDRRVLAYRDRIVAVEAMTAGDAEASTESIEREGRLWTSGLASGELTALQPTVYEDHLRDGPRGEILRAGLSIADTLGQSAEEDVRHGHAAVAARDALTGAEIAHSLRGFELQAFLQSLLEVRRSLVVLAQAWPSLPDDEKRSLRPRIERLVVDQKEVEDLLKLERDNLDDYERRQKLDSGPKETPMEIQSDASALKATSRSIRLNNERVRAVLGG